MAEKHQVKVNLVLDRRSQALNQWVKSLSDWQVNNFQMISGDASFRRYFRFSSHLQSFIAVDAPPETEKNAQFIGLSSALRNLGVCVPKVLHHDVTHGFLLIEDFGDTLFSQAITDPQKAPDLYQRALGLLTQLQKLPQLNLSQETFELPEYDAQLLALESNLFTHWLLQVHLKLTLTDPQQQLLSRVQHYLTQVFFAQPQVGVHRDYHSRNLMLLTDDKTGQDQIGVIDFQDAVKGPLTYDLVSLLRDCYVSWPDTFVEQQLRQIHGVHYQQYEWAMFKHWFDCTGMQRHLKAAGIFARLAHRDGKTGYIQDIPRALGYVVTVGRSLSRLPQLEWFAGAVDLIEQMVLPELHRADVELKNMRKAGG